MLRWQVFEVGLSNDLSFPEVLGIDHGSLCCWNTALYMYKFYYTQQVDPTHWHRTRISVACPKALTSVCDTFGGCPLIGNMEIINESLGLCNDSPEHQGCYDSSKFVRLQPVQNRVKLTTVLIKEWGEIWHKQCESSLQPSGLPGCRLQPVVAIGRGAFSASFPKNDNKRKYGGGLGSGSIAFN